MTNQTLSWLHFGDLHIQQREDENYQDFLSLVAEANEYLAGQIDFAFLPGDNADDGTSQQYELVSEALDKLKITFRTITGDHDRKTGDLDSYRRYLSKDLVYAETRGVFRLLFLNAMDADRHDVLDLGDIQLDWVQNQLEKATDKGLRPLMFIHQYPHKLATRGVALSKLISRYNVELVEMGHTHYNELSNSGNTIYAATRSTGQIEEGPPGFSITCIDGDVISWKFRERFRWPLVMITSPVDLRLITRPCSETHLVRGNTQIRAKVWGKNLPGHVTFRIDDGPSVAMRLENGFWIGDWNSSGVSNGSHHVIVEAVTAAGESGRDQISVMVSQAGDYDAPQRCPLDYRNAIGVYREKGILGTQLGPNENGTKGPWPSWRDK